jgi:hypothetical protein
MNLETGGTETASQGSSVLEVPGGLQGGTAVLLDHVRPHAQAIHHAGGDVGEDAVATRRSMRQVVAGGGGVDSKRWA